MDPMPGASFIPKKPLVAGIERGRGGLGGVVLLLSVVFFIGSICLAGGVFAYKQYLGGVIQQSSASLDRAQAAYDPAVLQDLIRLDDRIKNAKVVMQEHIAPSSLFTFLENTTLQNVRFTSFEYDETGSAGTTLSLRGEAPDFATVALQSDTFGSSRVLKDILFSDLTVTDSGKVGFTVHASVDPAFIMYSSYLAAQSATPTTQAPAQSAPPAATTTP